MNFSIKVLVLIGLVSWTGVVCSQSNLDQKLTLQLEDVSIKTALKKIEEQTAVGFAFSNRVPLNKKITAQYSNKTLRYILTNILEPNGLDYKIVGDNISVFVRKKKIEKNR